MSTSDEQTEADLELVLGTAVQEAKVKLLGLLTEDERRTRKATKDSDSTYPHTFEDTAKELAEAGDPRPIGEALEAFQTAVNAFWVHVFNNGTVNSICSAWRSKKSGAACRIPKTDIEGEIVWLLRDAVIRYKPGQGEFLHYATKTVFRKLAEWAASQTMPVHIPDRKARQLYGRTGKLRERYELNEEYLEEMESCEESDPAC